jgi:hypothetical protein
MQQKQLVNDFTAGILSQKWKGRYETEIFRKGLQELNNFVPFFPGGATLRPGTWYQGDIGNYAVRLIPFQVSDDVAYILEFSASKIRIWKNGALLLSEGNPITITTPYADQSILQFAQDGAKLFIASGVAPVKVLEMISIDTFTFGDLVITYNEGYQPFNGPANYPRAIAIFDGRLYLASTDAEPQTIWASQPYDYGNFVYFDTISYTSKQLREPQNAFTGTITKDSTRITGVNADEIAKMKIGDRITGEGIQYIYSAATTYITDIGVDYIDISLPATASGFKTLYSCWHDPSVPEYEDVSYTRDVITTASAFKKTIAGERNEKILWLSAGKNLVVGTSTAERIIKSGTTSADFSCQKYTDYGSAAIQPLGAANIVLFVSTNRRIARQYVYDSDSENYDAIKFNYLADETLTGIKQMDYQSHDSPVIWFVLDTGVLAGCVYDPALRVQAFFTATFSGLVESIAVITESGEDTVYLSINESGTRKLVKMGQLFDGMHLDFAQQTTVASRKVTNITGVSGAATLVYQNKLYSINVAGGTSNVPSEVPDGAIVTIGKTFTGTIKTMPTTGDPAIKMVPRASIRVQDTYPFKVGFENVEPETAKITGPYTGDVSVPIKSKWDYSGAVVITQDSPLNTTILALMTTIDVGGV